jgi:hypothetical protein
MAQLTSRTIRVSRGWLDRLKGLDRLYETTVTDGWREATGRGATPDASKQSAERRWVTRFGQATESTEYHLPSPTPSIALYEAISTSPATLDEVIDALRANLGEVIGALRTGTEVVDQAVRK